MRSHSLFRSYTAIELYSVSQLILGKKLDSAGERAAAAAAVARSWALPGLRGRIFAWQVESLHLPDPANADGLKGFENMLYFKGTPRDLSVYFIRNTSARYREAREHSFRENKRTKKQCIFYDPQFTSSRRFAGSREEATSFASSRCTWVILSRNKTEKIRAR